MIAHDPRDTIRRPGAPRAPRAGTMTGVSAMPSVAAALRHASVTPSTGILSEAAGDEKEGHPTKTQMRLRENRYRFRRTAILAALSHPGAPRVLTPATLHEWLTRQKNVDITPAVLREALSVWREAGLIDRITRGIDLNARASPRPRPAEAASWIRRGAVISLQYVLGQTGVLNNPTDWVTCVLPLSVSRAVGTVVTGAAVFQFSGLSHDLIPKPGEDWAVDAMQDGVWAATATPEKALLDWIHLARAAPSRWRPPPVGDIEWDRLDAARLHRLAASMGMHEEWDRQWACHLQNSVAKGRERGSTRRPTG